MSNKRRWSDRTTWDEVSRRAAGRRRYNSWRKLMATCRRAEVATLYRRLGGGHGVQAAMARQLGVSAATISRDLQALRAMLTPCPCCGSLVPRQRVRGPIDPSDPLGPPLSGSTWS